MWTCRPSKNFATDLPLLKGKRLTSRSNVITVGRFGRYGTTMFLHAADFILRLNE